MQDVHSGLRDIAEIRTLMERSTKFISLSGYSGIAVGILGLVAAGFGGILLSSAGISLDDRTDSMALLSSPTRIQLFLLGVAILLIAVGTVIASSRRLARRRTGAVPATVVWHLVLAFAMPVLVGGVLSSLFLFSGPLWLVVPMMLVFYGLGLFSAGSFTFGEVRTLGTIEILLGLTAALFPAHGLFFWAGGFGLLHIVYGLLFFRKYRQ